MPTVTQGTNSYISEADATAYFAERLHASDYTGADEADQQKALLMACRFLDSRMIWMGIKADDDQALQWPRSGCLDRNRVSIDDDVYPQELKDAQCELALILIGQDTAKPPDTAGFVSIEVESITLEIDKADRPKIIPDSVFELISHLGIRAGARGFKMVQLA